LGGREGGGRREEAGERGRRATMNDERGGSGSGGVFGEEAGGQGGTGRLYNPYADLYGAADLKSLESVYQLPSAPEYLFPDEAAVQRRNWSENLTYYTGCGYGSGAIAGGVKGAVEGLRSQEASDTTKIRVNRLLNASGQRGRATGNTLGILGLLFAGFESTASHYRDTDDMLNTVIAGLGTGVLYKAAAGPRTAAIAGALGGFAAAALVAGKQLSKRYMPI
jgi:import inner membrane translocase subunit TIM23